jgi:hypothetical protein
MSRSIRFLGLVLAISAASSLQTARADWDDDLNNNTGEWVIEADEEDPGVYFVLFDPESDEYILWMIRIDAEDFAAAWEAAQNPDGLGWDPSTSVLDAYLADFADEWGNDSRRATEDAEDVELLTFLGGSQIDFFLSLADLPTYVDAGAGDDVIVLGLGDHVVDCGAGNDLVYANSGNDRISGGDGDDILYGKSGSDRIDGGSGNDILVGGGYSIYGELDNDVLLGRAGDDELYGNEGDDDLYGGDGADYLEGGSGSDWIEAGRWEDEQAILGGSGDSQYGGSSNSPAYGDTFVFYYTQQSTLTKTGTTTTTVPLNQQNLDVSDATETNGNTIIKRIVQFGRPR